MAAKKEDRIGGLRDPDTVVEDEIASRILGRLADERAPR